MKRLWIGIGLLVCILIVGFGTSIRLSEIHTHISDQLDASARAAQSGQWDRADALAEQADNAWKDQWNFSAALADHTVLDEIDGLFAQAKVYRQSRDDVSYAAVCAMLSTSIEALQEAHCLTWWNFL